jgi:hypothetical protein
VEAGSERQYRDLEARIAEKEHQLEDALSKLGNEDLESVFGTEFSAYSELP